MEHAIIKSIISFENIITKYYSHAINSKEKITQFTLILMLNIIF